ncbi:hypothetical protein FACS189449_01720 [Alphaproteobacteria bacterium]|nr:hypothetical protein FACS189449_01720 [Alphaproteobacteria bacterium]
MGHFRYDELVQKALIAVVREVLEDVSANGLAGDHHFYVRFRTDHPKAKVPNYLKERHPEEVMIIIQHQFWNLKVFRDYFSVDLSFGGIQETLIIPFSALTAFVDPSVKFALQFTPSFNGSDFLEGGPKKAKAEKHDSDPGNGEGKIISFESFRKK